MHKSSSCLPLMIKTVRLFLWVDPPVDTQRCMSSVRGPRQHILTRHNMSSWMEQHAPGLAESETLLCSITWGTHTWTTESLTLESWGTCVYLSFIPPPSVGWQLLWGYHTHNGNNCCSMDFKQTWNRELKNLWSWDHRDGRDVESTLVWFYGLDSVWALLSISATSCTWPWGTQNPNTQQF